MDHVRPIDLRSFTRNGLEWVVGRSGGISTFASAAPPGRGRIWRLPAGNLYPDELVLNNDHGNHWSWEPAQDMELSRYRACWRPSAEISCDFGRVLYWGFL
jgi:hypothetical protein